MENNYNDNSEQIPLSGNQDSLHTGNSMKIDSYFNARLLLTIQTRMRSKVADVVANTLRIMFAEEGMFMILPFMIWFFQGPRVIILLFINVTNEIVNGGLKWMTQKPRPFWVVYHLKNITSTWENSYSYPSGHSQSSASLSCSIIILFGEFLPLYIISLLIVIPMLTGMSRIYLGVHGIECVITGWLIGILFSISMCSICPSLFAWFDQLYLVYGIIFALVTNVIVPYSILYGILKLFPTPTVDTINQWTKNAICNTYGTASDITTIPLRKREINTARTLNKYDLNIWALFGGTIGLLIQLADKNIVPGFIDKMCVVSSGNVIGLLLSVLTGYVVLIVCLFPFVFMFPRRFIDRNKRFTAILCKIIGSFLFGLWMVFLCPFVSYRMFGSC